LPVNAGPLAGSGMATTAAAAAMPRAAVTSGDETSVRVEL